jgi:hypothetical protein
VPGESAAALKSVQKVLTEGTGGQPAGSQLPQGVQAAAVDLMPRRESAGGAGQSRGKPEANFSRPQQ